MAMSPDVEIDIGMPFPAPTANFAKLLELATEGDLPQFQAQMVKYPLDFTAGPEVYHDRTSLHMAALHGQAEIVKCIISSPDMSVQIANASDSFGYTSLHLAVRSQHESVVRILIKSSLMLPDRVLAATGELDELGEDYDGFTPLHLAAAGGNLPIVKLLLQRSGIRGGLTANDIPVNLHATTWQGLTALDIAKQRKHVELVKRLEAFDVNWLELERQKSANSVNDILLGAALVGTVAFGSWQQPPQGFPTWDQSHNQRHCSASSYDSSTAARAGWLVFHVHFCVIFLLCGFPCDWHGCLHSICPRDFIETGGEQPTKVGSERVHLSVSGYLLSHALFPAEWPPRLDAVTPPGTAMQSVGHFILLALPFFNSAYILRYVVLPKGLFRRKTWVLVLILIMASGLMIGVGFLINYLIVLDPRKFNCH